MNTTREDILISRVVDREDDPEDWRELDRRATERDGLWSDVLYALRQDSAVRASVRTALAAASGCQLPAHRRTAAVFYPWVGWIAAAVLACLWLTHGTWTGSPATAPETGAAVTPVVVRELPRVVVEAHPSEDGQGLDVLYVRRVLERAVVRTLYQISEDEHGQPVPTEVSLARFERPSSY